MSDHVCGILLLLDFFLSFVKVLKAMLASSCHLLFMTSDGKVVMRTQRSVRIRQQGVIISSFGFFLRP